MSASRARRILAGGVLVTVVLLTGCTDVAQDRPLPIDPGEVPFGLLDAPGDGTPATTPTTTPAPDRPVPSPGATADDGAP